VGSQRRKRKRSFTAPAGPSLRPPVPHIITGQKVTDYKLEFVQKLRREMTHEERILWKHLRANRLCGLHFRRQQLIHGFIADFYCHSAGVVVEVDGDIHKAQVEYDSARDATFNTIGLFVLRFRNEEIIREINVVLEKIATACTERINTQRASPK
jgi:very-short-patch-repair endonuclease